MRRPVVALFPLLFAFAAAADDDRPARFADTIAPFFAPITTDRAALAPDGKHVAYTLHQGTTAYVIVMDVDHPDVKLTIAVAVDRARIKTDEGVIKNDLDSEEIPFLADEKTPATVPYLGWASATRLIMSSDIPELVAADVDGQHAGKLVDREDVSVLLPSENGADAPPSRHSSVRRPPAVLELLPDDPSHLLVKAEGVAGSDFVSTVYRADAQTGKLKVLHDDNFRPGAKILHDKQGNPRLSYASFTREPDFSYLGVNGRGGAFAKFAGPDLAPTLRLSPENYLGERSFPIAFDYDPEVVYLASNLGRETFGLYALDLRTKKRTAVLPEDPHVDFAAVDGTFDPSPLVFDRYRQRLAGVRITGVTPTTRWLDPELADVQRLLDTTFPSRFVQVIGWDEARARFLVQVSSCSDPGRFFIFFRSEKKALEFVRLVPGLGADALSITKPFEFDTPAGVHLTGYLTRPTDARITPPPLLICLHDGPWSRDLPAYNPDVQALAAMGLVVAQVNYRGSAGFGRAHREGLLAGLTLGLDRAPVDDLLATADWVIAHQPIDRKRIALFGIGYGGTLALRALQLEPARFRCAITIDAPTDLARWLSTPDLNLMRAESVGIPGLDLPAADLSFGPSLRKAPPNPPKVDFFGELRHAVFGRDSKRLAEISPLRHADQITRPVLLIQNYNHPDLPPDAGSKLRDALVRHGVAAEYLETTAEFGLRLPKASVGVFSRIEEFINLNVYDYGVKVGTPETVK